MPHASPRQISEMLSNFKWPDRRNLKICHIESLETIDDLFSGASLPDILLSANMSMGR